MKSFHVVVSTVLLALVLAACSEESAQELRQSEKTISQTANQPKITFVELGSISCIPCRKMQPIMTSVEEKYGGQVEVVFYDVWRPEQRHYAQEFGIRLIPTQVFLDEFGNEIMRHEGFFPEEEIDDFLQAQGLTIKSGS